MKVMLRKFLDEYVSSKKESTSTVQTDNYILHSKPKITVPLTSQSKRFCILTDLCLYAVWYRPSCLTNRDVSGV